jgi:hypothetical protein
MNCGDTTRRKRITNFGRRPSSGLRPPSPLTGRRATNQIFGDGNKPDSREKRDRWPFSPAGEKVAEGPMRASGSCENRAISAVR